jgi:hypothetical protein
MTMQKKPQQHQVDHEAMVRASDDPTDPVFHNPAGHWFYDETWSVAHGPYGSEDEARSALSEYAKTL